MEKKLENAFQAQSVVLIPWKWNTLAKVAIIFITAVISWDLQQTDIVNKGGKFLKKLWRCVGGRV